MPVEAAELEALLTLSVVPGIGPVRLRHILRLYGSAVAAVRAGERAVGGEAFRVLSSRNVRARVARAVDTIADLEIRVLTDTDEDYPKRLHHLKAPPVPLFVRGYVELVDTPVVAVVGARRHTRYGADAARSLAVDLAQAGVTILSGLARGIDTIAHQAAAPDRTIAVLGCGLDISYPRRNERLQEQIATEGLVLSEFVPGERPHGWDTCLLAASRVAAARSKRP
jgi:DNA processing protein